EGVELDAKLFELIYRSAFCEFEESLEPDAIYCNLFEYCYHEGNIALALKFASTHINWLGFEEELKEFLEKLNEMASDSATTAINKALLNTIIELTSQKLRRVSNDMDTKSEGAGSALLPGYDTSR